MRVNASSETDFFYCRSRKSSNNDKEENSDKEDVDYEDDPNKLWCICNKPHGNR